MQHVQGAPVDPSPLDTKPTLVMAPSLRAHGMRPKINIECLLRPRAIAVMHLQLPVLQVGAPGTYSRRKGKSVKLVPVLSPLNGPNTVDLAAIVYTTAGRNSGVNIKHSVANAL